MRLTRRDGFMAVLMGAATAVMLAVTQGWDWPLLGSYRTGTLAMFVIGQGMCAAGARDVMTSQKGSAYVVTMSTIGAGALVTMIVGLITASAVAFVTLWGIILVMWAVTTVRHAIRPTVAVTIPDTVPEEWKEPALKGR